MSTISDNLKEIEDRINAACARSGRDRSEIKLLCVTKTKPVEMLSEAYACGYREFGENKVQEIAAKKPVLPDDIKWHMIGHLQTNKVKQVIDKAVMIHSVDSVHLAEEISKRAEAAGIVMPVLVEVNVAKEDTKFGVMPEDTEDFIRKIAVLPSIEVQGLMTSAPYTEDPESNRPFFCQLRKLAIDIKRKSIDNVSIRELSMGMTGDFETAIEEGSSIIRVGTGIFGERHYS